MLLMNTIQKSMTSQRVNINPTAFTYKTKNAIEVIELLLSIKGLWELNHFCNLSLKHYLKNFDKIISVVFQKKAT